MGDESRKDRWLASGACVLVAVMLGVICVWAARGVGAAGQDVERFGQAQRSRASRDAAAFGAMMASISGVCALGSAGLIVLAAWIPLGGRRRRATRARR